MSAPLRPSSASARGPVLVGIAGGTAGGKSTVAHAFADALGDDCLLVAHDRYYRTVTSELAAEGRWNFDHPDALETERLVADLDALCAGRSARLPRYDFSTHGRLPEAEWDTVEPRPVIVVEGILVLADPALRERFDVAAYVACPDDVRLARRIRRDLVERGRELDDVLRQYLGTVRPMHELHVAPSRLHADLVLDGTAPVRASVAALSALLPR